MTEPEPRQPATAAGLRHIDLERCPTCDSGSLVRLPADWQSQVNDKGRVIPIVACGNPWHYCGMAEAADASGLRAWIEDRLRGFEMSHGLTDESVRGARLFAHWLDRFPPDAALAAVERSATSAEPAGEPTYDEFPPGHLLHRPPVAGPDAGEGE